MGYVMDLGYLFGSRVRAGIIGWLYSHPGERFFVRQLADRLGEDATNISRELIRLEKAGLVISTREGRQKYYSANVACPIYNELKSIAIKTVGVTDIIRHAIQPLGNSISLCLIFGSMANAGISESSDVDMLVVGSVNELDLHKRIADAEETISRTINYTLMSNEEFDRRKHEHGEFVDRILSGPKIVIVGDPDL